MAETVPAARRTTAHDHRQLADALGWSVAQVDKAVALGVLPPYDLKTPRWKAATVDALTGRWEELAAALDEGALLTEDEMIAALGLEWGDWRRGRDHDVIPGPDRGEFWSRAAAAGLASRGPVARADPAAAAGSAPGRPAAVRAIQAPQARSSPSLSHSRARTSTAARKPITGPSRPAPARAWLSEIAPVPMSTPTATRS